MDGIPEELKKYPHWINWKLVDGEKRPAKKLKTGHMTFEQAASKSEKVGFVLSASDPFVCFDFDKCIEDGEITDPRVASVVKQLNSYTEISQSGTGLHVFVKGRKPGDRSRTDKGKVEIYDKDRFIAVTGNVFQGKSTIKRRPRAIKEIYSEIFGDETSPSGADKASSPTSLPNCRDKDDTLDRIHHSKDAFKFDEFLNEGARAGSDRSASDQSFFNMLAFYSRGNVEVMKEIAFESALYRSKWDRTDYINRTINVALETVPPPRVQNDYFIYDLHTQEITPPQWLLEGYLVKDSLATLIGNTGIGKSFVAIDIGLSVSTGTEWHGCKVEQGGVLYLCGEGKNGIKARIRAWLKHHNVSSPGNFFGVSQSPAVMLDETFVDDLITQIQNAEQFMGSVGMVIIDTLNTNWGGGDENAVSDMTKFTDACRRIRDTTGACVLIVHHTAKGNNRDGRGSSSLKGAMDTQLLLSEDKGVTELRVQKQKDHYAEPPFTLELKRVEITAEITSCVAILKRREPTSPEDEPWEEDEFERRLSKQKQLFVCFREGYDPDNVSHREQLMEKGFSKSVISKAKAAYEPDDPPELEQYTLAHIGLEPPKVS